MDRYVMRELRDFPVPPPQMMTPYHANMQRQAVPVIMDGQMYQHPGYGAGEMGATYEQFRAMSAGAPGGVMRAPPPPHSMYYASPHGAMERPISAPYGGGPSVYTEGYSEPRFLQPGTYDQNGSDRITDSNTMVPAPPQFSARPPRLGSNSAHAGSNTAHVGSNSPQVGSNSVRVGSNSARVGSLSPHVGSNSAHVGSNPTHVGSKYEQREPSTPERSFPVRTHTLFAASPSQGIPAASKSRPAVSTSGGSSATPQEDSETKPRSQADKQKELQKDGVRVFAGPVEKVIKWHKALQDIQLPCLYEVVARVVSVRAGPGCVKNILVRDEGGPVLQVAYYEIDFLLPDLQPNVTVRVLGKMIVGTACKLQAYSVRRASGDDVAALPRRAAVTAYQLAKILQNYGA